LTFVSRAIVAAFVVAAAAPPQPVTGQTAVPGPAVAQMGGGAVTDIRIEGAQRIEPETIRSYLLIQPGDAWDEELVDKSLKALFATGLFADVNLRRVGNTLVIRVVENPIINRIAFEGNNKIDEKDLTAEIQLRPRVVYTRTRVQNDVNRILDLYRRHGRFGATVEPKVIQLSENRVDLVFEINIPACAALILSAIINLATVNYGVYCRQKKAAGIGFLPVTIVTTRIG
jgi:outer membrane protein insertion porin family